MAAQIGLIEPGWRADLIVFGMTIARSTPMHGPISHLVYTTDGDDVRTTIVHGKVIMRDRRMITLDEAAVLHDVRVWVEKVRADN